jgi:D-alanyl-D-alanine carboxypeptidase (penicillin-binding protein 5/6)
MPVSPRVSPCRWMALVLSALLILAILSLGALHAETSVIAVDVYNKKIHVEQGGNVKRPVGGLAKIATALVTLDWADVTKVPLNALATVSEADLHIAGSNSLGFMPGDQVTLRDLIYAAMMSSDNVAATTLASFVGRDINSRRGRGSDPVATFVGEMNKLAVREGMKNTRFSNPHGTEIGRTAAISTAGDLAKLSMYAISRASFRFYTNQRSRDITVLRGGAPTRVQLQNTNSLLGVGTIDGIKTGNTPASGGCVIITEERPGTVMKDQAGASVVFRHRMVAIVLGSPDPFGEAQGLLQQGWSVYDQWLQTGRPVTNAKQLLSSF